MSMKFVLVINFKMPTLVGILKLMARTNNIVCCSQLQNCLIFFFYNIYEDYKYHAHMVMHEKKFITPGPG